MDQLICINIFDEQIGTCGKLEVHEKGLLHRAFSVFLVDLKRQKMLIQQRAIDKYHSGGLWANTCCSHPRNGEELIQAAQRRLMEENGITCPIEELFSFIYYKKFENGLSEYESDHVFIGFYDSTKNDWQADPDEIQAMAWIDLDILAKELCKKPEKYAAWFLTAAPKVIKYIKKDKQ